MNVRFLSVAALAAMLAAPAAAQAPNQTGTGGGPASTIYAPNTSSVGRTMPPVGGGEARGSQTAERETRMEKKNDKIDTGICIGCDK